MKAEERFACIKKLVAVILILQFAGCSGANSPDRGLDKDLQEKLLREFADLRAKGSGSLGEEVFKEKDVDKVCFQRPYANEADFESQIERTVSKFERINDDRYRWWFLTRQGFSMWIDVPRASVADLDRATVQACYSALEYRIQVDCKGACVYQLRRR